MKKMSLLCVIVLFAVGIVSAQSWSNNYPQSVNISGTLEFRDGTIAISSNNTVYYIPSLERYIGFIDGLKEGGHIIAEGFIYNNRLYNCLQPSRITINGKEYNFSADNTAWGWGNNRNDYRRHNAARLSWCCR